MDAAVWWKHRLQAHKQPVLFSWSALAFQHSDGARPGLILWAGTVIVLLYERAALGIEGSLVYVTGTVLFLAAVGYYLVAMAISHNKDSLYPEWGVAHETDYGAVCQHIASCGQVVRGVADGVITARRDQPKAFYVTGFAVAFVLNWGGYWLPTGIVIWPLVFSLLLLPPALSRGWLTEENRRAVQVFLREVAVVLAARWKQWIEKKRKRN